MNSLFSRIAEHTTDTSHTSNKNLSKTHYRSKLYTSKIGVNPLVTAAHPVFSILERINLSDKPPELALLQENFSHELQAFMTKAKSSEHTQEMILIAHYVLSATIDEVVEKACHKNNQHALHTRVISLNAIGDIDAINSMQDKHSHTHSEINPDINPDNHVFDILENAMIKPNFYLDIIEFIYFCIITGFEGKYRTDPNGKQALENTLDALHKTIQEHKPSNIEKLFIQPTSTQRFASLKPFPWLGFILSLSAVIILGYFFASYQLNQQADDMLNTSFLGNKHATQQNY